MHALGAKHTWYQHDAFVRIDNWKTTRKIEVVSNGSSGRITEIRNIDTGDLMSRDNSRMKN
ncbi:hypothetical protein N9Y42_00050 [Mariniblastus sp.]|nr:hypothetical protein [Mariniblastus sp.]